MIRIVYLDMDGVITNFNKAVCEQFDFPYPPHIYHFFPKIRFEVNEFCNRSFWRNLEWMHDGQEILRAVIDTFGPEKVYLLTKAMPNVETASGKMIWIQDNLPTFSDRVIIITLGVPKSLFAQSDTLLIDDRDTFIDRFIDGGGQGLLVPRPWNRAYKQANISANVVRDHLEKLKC